MPNLVRIDPCGCELYDDGSRILWPGHSHAKPSKVVMTTLFARRDTYCTPGLSLDDQRLLNNAFRGKR
jgi:hypothetical protein